MGKRFQLHVLSSAKQGQDEAYNRWYDDVHFVDILALDWVHGGKRLRQIGEGPQYLAIYDVEADDASEILPKLYAASAGMVLTDTLDPSSVSFRIYEDYAPAY